MLILEKHVVKSYIMGLVFCLILLMVIGVIGDILSFLDNIFKDNIPIRSVLAFYFYLSPFAFVHMLPFACLLAAVYVFNSLSRTHEITAVIASGLSLWRLLKPVLAVTLLLCVAAFIVNDRLVPYATEKADIIRQEELEAGRRDDGKTSGIRDMAVYGKAGQIIFARWFDPGSNELSGVVIHEEDASHNIVRKISARIVRWDGAGSWIGEDVIVFDTGAGSDIMIDPGVYKTKELNIKETPGDLRKVRSDPRFMSYVQLRDYLDALRAGPGETLWRLRVDLNYKLAFPFTAFMIVIVGVPFSIDTGRANPLIGMARGIMAGTLYLPAVAFCLALGKGGHIHPVLSAWLAMIVFTLSGVYCVNRKS